MNEVKFCVTKKWRTFFQHVHLKENIFNELDDASIEECRLVCKSWRSYLDQNKHVRIRLIRKSVDCFEQVEESWKEVFKKSNSDTIEQLFGAVKDLYGVKPKNQYCHLGLTPLHVVAIVGDVNIFKTVMEKTGDIQLKNGRDSRTPYHFAAEIGHFGICKFMVDNYKIKNPKSSSGFTPLHAAASNGHLEVWTLTNFR